MNILVVDNDESVLKSIKKALERAGYNCVVHNSLKETFCIYKEKNINALIIDLFIGDDISYDFIDQIIDYDKKAKIIIVTGHEKNEICGIDGKIFGFFQKPINFLDLIEALKRIEQQRGSPHC